MLSESCFWWSAVYDFELTAVYLPGEENLFSDCVSRLGANKWLLQWALLNQCVMTSPQLDYFIASLSQHMSPHSPPTDSDTRRCEKELDEEVARYKGLMLAVSTQRAYRYQLKSFLTFCTDFGYSPVPASDSTLCRYVAFLGKTLKYNSVRPYLSAIRILHLECNLPNPVLHNWALGTVLKGMRRDKGSTVTAKLAMTPKLLLSLRSLLVLSDPFDTSFWAASLTMFFGLLRKSNVFPPSASGFVATKHLSRSDFQLPLGPHESDRVLLISHWAKNNQFKERKHVAYLPYLHNHPLCHISAIVRAFLLTPMPDTYVGPAFLVPSPSGFTPLLYSKFLMLLKSKLKRLDMDSSRFATHSFRRGGATWAFAQGIPGEIIMAMGDWHSAAYLSYVTIPPSLKQATMMQFAASLPTTLGLE